MTYTNEYRVVRERMVSGIKYSVERKTVLGNWLYQSGTLADTAEEAKQAAFHIKDGVEVVEEFQK